MSEVITIVNNGAHDNIKMKEIRNIKFSDKWLIYYDYAVKFLKQ